MTPTFDAARFSEAATRAANAFNRTAEALRQFGRHLNSMDLPHPLSVRTELADLGWTDPGLPTNGEYLALIRQRRMPRPPSPVRGSVVSDEEQDARDTLAFWYTDLIAVLGAPDGDGVLRIGPYELRRRVGEAQRMMDLTFATMDQIAAGGGRGHGGCGTRR